MKDNDFLHWVADRLVFLHGDAAEVDFVGKLRSIANALPEDQRTPNTWVLGTPRPIQFYTKTELAPKSDLVQKLADELGIPCVDLSLEEPSDGDLEFIEVEETITNG